MVLKRRHEKLMELNVEKLAGGEANNLAFPAVWVRKFSCGSCANQKMFQNILWQDTNLISAVLMR